jgi:hypothetical protein
MDIAEDVGPDQRSDPFTVRIVVRGGGRRVKSVHQIPVGDAFGRVHLMERQTQQPALGHILRAKIGPVGLQQVQAENGVVDVIITPAAADTSPRGMRPVVAEHVPLRDRIRDGDVVANRIGVGELEETPDALPRPDIPVLDRLAQHVPGDPAPPGTENPVVEVGDDRHGLGGGERLDDLLQP